MHKSVNNLLDSDFLNVNQVAICIEMNVVCKYTFHHPYLIVCLIHMNVYGNYVRLRYVFNLSVFGICPNLKALKRIKRTHFLQLEIN